MTLIDGLLESMFPPRREMISELIVGKRGVVCGRVVARERLASELTGDPCVYYRHTVEEWRQSTMIGVGSDGFWSLIEQDEAITEFYVADSQGSRILVCPANSRVERAPALSGIAVNLGVMGRRAQQLLISDGDTVEIEGMIESRQDPYMDHRGFRDNTETLAMAAPAGDVVKIRLLERAVKA